MRLLFLSLLFHSGMQFSTKDQDNDLWISSAQGSIKALGGIKLVINPISTDSILVDHMTLLPMGSIVWHLGVIIIH